MRAKREYATINITKEVKERLNTDREKFQEVIGGGRWSLNDTIVEYQKILHTKR